MKRIFFISLVVLTIASCKKKDIPVINPIPSPLPTYTPTTPDKTNHFLDSIVGNYYVKETYVNATAGFPDDSSISYHTLVVSRAGDSTLTTTMDASPLRTFSYSRLGSSPNKSHFEAGGGHYTSDMYFYSDSVYIYENDGAGVGGYAYSNYIGKKLR